MTTASGEPHVHAIVVAYHGAAELAGCLEAIAGQVSAVTVVDNSSSAAVSAAARGHGAHYIDAGANRGFAAAVNIGLAHTADGGRDVLLLNPDAVVAAGGIAAMARFLHSGENARIAAVAPFLVYPGGAEQRVAWPFPSPRRMWVEAVGLDHLCVWPPQRSAGREDHTFFLIGAVLLLRREAIEDVGGFDERFFVYAEEADWQRRANDRGWGSAICHSASAEHVSGTAVASEMRREALLQAAQETFIKKWHGQRGWMSYRVAALVDATIRMIVAGSGRRSAARRVVLLLCGPSRVAAALRRCTRRRASGRG
jgi:GT2 family glycosyltransferase